MLLVLLVLQLRVMMVVVAQVGTMVELQHMGEETRSFCVQGRAAVGRGAGLGWGACREEERLAIGCLMRQQVSGQVWWGGMVAVLAREHAVGD